MPLLGPILIPILTAFAGSLVARMLLGASLAFVTYNWIQDFTTSAQIEMQGLMNNLPSDILGLVSILKIPQALSVVMSALGISAFVKASKIFIGKSN